MLRIHNTADAKALWDDFNVRFEKLAAKKKVVVNGRSHKEINITTEQDLKKLQTVQRFWKRKRSVDTVVTVNPRGNHNNSFLHLINNQEVKKSLNKTKQAALLTAIESCQWDDEIFRDKTIHQLALALYASEKITRQQFFSILERLQTHEAFPIQETYQILDEQGQFTEAAKHILIKSFAANNSSKAIGSVSLSEENLEEFRLLVKAMPESERVFYVSGFNTLDPKFDGNTANFTQRLLQFGVFLYTKDSLVHTSCGVREALGLCRFGIQNYIPVALQFGKINLEGIESGVRSGARNAYVYNPDLPRPHEIHEFKEPNDFTITAHDIYHSLLMSFIPKNFKSALLRMVDRVRVKTGWKWSKEVWDWIDSEFTYFAKSMPNAYKSNLNKKLNTEIFCQMLFINTAPKVRSLLLNDNELTVAGIAVILDMIENKDVWLEFNIDPLYLPLPYKQYYHFIKIIYELIRGDDFELQALKCSLFYELFENGETDKIVKLNNIINKNEGAIEKLLDIRKLKKATNAFIEPPDWDNLLVLCYDGSVVHNENKRAIINLLLESKHAARKNHMRTTLASHATKEETKFRLKPTFMNWVRNNPLKTVFSFVTVIGIPILVGYALVKTSQQKKMLKKTTPSVDIVADALRLKKGFIPDKATVVQNKENSKARKVENLTELLPNIEKAEEKIEDLTTILPHLKIRGQVS